MNVCAHDVFLKCLLHSNQFFVYIFLCLHVLLCLPVHLYCIYIRLGIMCFVLSTGTSSCLYLYVILGGQAYVYECMFHHHEDSNNLSRIAQTAPSTSAWVVKVVEQQQ